MLILGLSLIVWYILTSKDRNLAPDPNAKLKVIREIPGNASSNGSKEIQIGNHRYIFPNDFFVGEVKNQWQDGMALGVSWPAMTTTNKAHKNTDNILIYIRVQRTLPHSISRADLERTIIARHGEPVEIEQFIDIQEYPSKNATPHYRSIDPLQVWADGLPTYFYCTGTALSLMKPGDRAPTPSECYIEMTWPDALEVTIKFDKSHIGDWREIHDSTITMLRSMELNAAPNPGTLLQKDN